MAEPYEGTCRECKFVEPHRLSGELTGYGSCTKHFSTQLKTVDDSVSIMETPIVWHAMTCVLGESKE